MGNILEEIADRTRKRVASDKERCGMEDLERLIAERGRKGGAFFRALSKPGLRFICEVKKASPSKGVISEDFPYMDIAKSYERAGADALSCLTEPEWFLGSDKIFSEIRAEITAPMLRKDFTVDAYQIYQAKAMGADAVLLICAILTQKELKEFLRICAEIKMDALVETHDAREIDMALSEGARLIGVNNRNLKDFSVDFSNAKKLREKIPSSCVFVAESGVRTPEDIAALKEIGADAVLMGEVLMRAENTAQALTEMRRAAV